ncbi:hypothetical protein QAD02_016275 [Eretmocerus hayati]|uniref:Uncharacterized protein n=1 Tax=Eretmocerus hayati TaxID=131215 RepID=A0ACC2PBL0_9HYME|nr:hypothetical protein QAD02_016275 [Eretmocerus hayati]
MLSSQQHKSKLIHPELEFLLAYKRVTHQAINICRTEEELNKQLTNIRKTLIGKAQNFVFCVAVVGSRGEIKHSYVIIGGVRYEVESPIKAVDVCFQCVDSLKKKFPATNADV